MGTFKKKNTRSDIEVALLNNAADAGDSEAMFNLGLTAHEAGDLKGAQSWWEQAMPMQAMPMQCRI